MRENVAAAIRLAASGALGEKVFEGIVDTIMEANGLSFEQEENANKTDIVSEIQDLMQDLSNRGSKELDDREKVLSFLKNALYNSKDVMAKSSNLKVKVDDEFMDPIVNSMANEKFNEGKEFVRSGDNGKMGWEASAVTVNDVQQDLLQQLDTVQDKLDGKTPCDNAEECKEDKPKKKFTKKKLSKHEANRRKGGEMPKMPIIEPLKKPTEDIVQPTKEIKIESPKLEDIVSSASSIDDTSDYIDDAEIKEEEKKEFESSALKQYIARLTKKIKGKMNG